jgi:hypothetical protein
VEESGSVSCRCVRASHPNNPYPPASWNHQLKNPAERRRSARAAASLNPAERRRSAEDSNSSPSWPGRRGSAEWWWWSSSSSSLEASPREYGRILHERRLPLRQRRSNRCTAVGCNNRPVIFSRIVQETESEYFTDPPKRGLQPAVGRVACWDFLDTGIFRGQLG